MDFLIASLAKKKSYEDAIAEIEANPLIANKDRAKEIVNETYGKKPKTEKFQPSAGKFFDSIADSLTNSIGNFLFK